jgi:hypothetical protein
VWDEHKLPPVPIEGRAANGFRAERADGVRETCVGAKQMASQYSRLGGVETRPPHAAEDACFPGRITIIYASFSVANFLAPSNSHSLSCAASSAFITAIAQLNVPAIKY